MLGIIMAGGKGSRLFPLTEYRPKPLVDVLGIPVINYVKDALTKLSIDELIVTTGYQGDSLAELVYSWNRNSDFVCSVNQEANPMGTAGSVKLLEDKLEKTFVVASGDSILSSDLAMVLKAHRDSNAAVTMALWEVDNPTEYGIVGLSETKGGIINGKLSEGYITKFLEKPSPTDAFSNVINAGLYVIEPEVINHIPRGKKFDFSKQLFPHLLQEGYTMYGVKLNGVWFDVGTPGELIKAQNYLVHNSAELPFKLPIGVLTKDGGYLLQSSHSESPVVDSVLCENAFLGKNTECIESLLMKASKVGDRCSIISSIVGQNSSIGDDCSLINCVIGDNVKIPAGSILTEEKVSNGHRIIQDK